MVHQIRKGSTEHRLDPRQLMNARACEIEVNLIVVADAGKSEQFHHKLAEPGGVLGKMNQAGMELGRCAASLISLRLAARTGIDDDGAWLRRCRITRAAIAEPSAVSRAIFKLPIATFGQVGDCFVCTFENGYPTRKALVAG